MATSIAVAAGIAVAVGLLALAGCGGKPLEGPAFDGSAPPLDALVSGQDAADDTSAAAVDISGRWAMFAFEDPVAVEITQSGNTLSGMGCYGGLPTPDDAIGASSCAPLRGVVEGRHVKFTFASTLAPYAADVFASADGRRMAGRFHDTAEWGAPFSWLRIGPADRWLPAADAGAPRDVVQMASTDYVLSPVGAPPPGVELSGPGFDAYFLGFGFAHGRGAVVLGTLGAFWESELSWNAADQVLMAGPVPITSPNIPTTLRLHFASPSGSTLVDVEATMPSGLVYRFSATPRI